MPARSLSRQELKQRQKLKDQKVVDHDLILLTGLSDKMASEALLGRHEFLGQYGAIRKISINRDKLGGRDKGEYIQIYVTFTNELCASLAILALDGLEWEGRALRATFGTNKYCPSFLRGYACGNSDCLYLHKVTAEGENVLGEDIPTPRMVSRLTVASFVNNVLPRWRAAFKAKAEEGGSAATQFPRAALIMNRIRQYAADNGLGGDARAGLTSAKKPPKKRDTASKRPLCTNDMLWSADEEGPSEKCEEYTTETADESSPVGAEGSPYEENNLLSIASRLTELDQHIFLSLNRSLSQLRREQPKATQSLPQEGGGEHEILQNIRQFCEKLETTACPGSNSRNEAGFQLFNQSYLVELPLSTKRSN